MKLLRYGPAGEERPALLEGDGTIRDLDGIIQDVNGASVTPDGLRQIAAVDPITLPIVSDVGRIGSCISGVGKFICIGLNYIDHARETGNQAPAEPVVFMKATSAIVGPNDDIVQPRGSTKLDWEVELGVVIGTKAKYVAEDRALAHVAGYFLANDVSERALQTEGTGQWTKGKSCDTFGPIGPWLVTADEISDPQDLRLWLEVDGIRRQDGTTANMIFSVARIVSYLSGLMTLHPGDVIITGTPAGVGQGMKPPIYLRPGQIVTLGIEGLGEQRQIVVADAA
ncbi:MAG TPA: fumarylacetoacetate hydrolase family protein [Bosea sp. (in: a-proteobacteria)]|jgi:2-keto-4-pentenoate hydratase/2-oxohepta-3-ene-1,7-dioic acid hydratase in catechol pathway|uniref:fumarylacetoacetate hydrolase family protein n=1 Tax=Bosea sp. (in: a-proteobacteria) TaxID=1871050 RepID=UPI002E168841|nr:fumarylacetoacetate hydrolase family protein [Bosea sp. (in: a-proteobacteria)]